MNESWILEARRRLPQPQNPLASENTAEVALTPLFVDANQLWTMMRQASWAQQPWERVTFPHRPVETGVALWSVCEALARDTIEGLEAGLLELGTLGPVRSPHGHAVAACVAAIPRPEDLPRRLADDSELFALPLMAFSNAALVEEQHVAAADDQAVPITVHHVGNRRIAGPSAEILSALISHLGDG